MPDTHLMEVYRCREESFSRRRQRSFARWGGFDVGIDVTCGFRGGGQIQNHASGVDLTFATPWSRIRKANVKSKTPLETYICWWSFDSNICKSACQIGMQMLESDH